MTAVPEQADTIYRVDAGYGWISARISDIPDWREEDSVFIKALKVEHYDLRRRYEELVAQQQNNQTRVVVVETGQ